MNILILILLLLFPTLSHAEYLGCFEPNEAVEIKSLFMDSTGARVDPTSPGCEIFDPNDTTATTCTSGPTKIGTIVGWYESSHTIPASPLAGTWYAKVNGTISSVVQEGTDTFLVMDTAGECSRRPIATGTENGAASATVIYWTGAINQRTRVGMCLEATVGSNTERSKITGAGSGYNKVKGFSAAPTDASTINIWTDGCD